MRTNERRENSKLLIYSILLSQTDPFYRPITFYPNRVQGIAHMTEIAKLGGTKKLFEAQSPEEINNAFQSIANAINPKYGLKIIKKFK